MPAGFQQPPVLKLSPDYKVFISGLSKLPISGQATESQRTPLGRGAVSYRDLNSDVAGVTVSMGIESSPGTASFTVNVPRHRTEALAYLRDGEVLIKPMMEVHVYLRGRFNNQDNQPQYYLVFWGVVSTVQEQYSDGTHSLNVSCLDILHWWEITKVVTSPSAVAAAQVGDQEISGLSSIYTQLDAHSIIYDLGKISMQNFMLPNTINISDAETGYQSVEQFNREAPFIAKYWRERFAAIRSSLRLYAFAGFQTCSKRTFGPNKPDNNAQSEGDTEQPGPLSEQGTSGNYVYTVVKVCENQIEAMHPYKTIEGRSVGQQESQQRSKLEVAKEVANNTHWEFFLDMDGSVVFKPPFYNLDVRGNEASVILDIDIINYTRTETENGAVTSLYVAGRKMSEQSSETPWGGWWIDWPMALTLGLRHEQREEWRVLDPKQCKQYAQAEINKHNAMLDTLDLTIPGRPELRLGYPVYVEPLDSFYYVYNIDHTIQSGGAFTTTLSLKGKRTRIRDSSGRVQKLLAAVQKSGSGQSGKVMENGEDGAGGSCVPTTLMSATQTLADSYARALASSETEVSSAKGKSIRTLSASPSLSQEALAEERKKAEAEALLESDPCNAHYQEQLRKKIAAVNEASKKTRMTADGNAPGDWVFVEDFPVIPGAAGSNKLAPVDGSEIVDAIQFTDEQGYKLFGPFLYGRFVSLGPSGRMESSTNESGEKHVSEVAKSASAGPGGSGTNDGALRYTIDPNLGAITLKLGSAVGRLGAGVGGEALAATSRMSEDGSLPKRSLAGSEGGLGTEPQASQGGSKNLSTGKASVDDVNNCEAGTSGQKAGPHTPEAQEKYKQLRRCMTQGNTEEQEETKPNYVPQKWAGEQ